MPHGHFSVFLVLIQFLSQGILLFDDLLIVAVACFFCVDMAHTVSSSSLTLFVRQTGGGWQEPQHSTLCLASCRRRNRAACKSEFSVPGSLWCAREAAAACIDLPAPQHLLVALVFFFQLMQVFLLQFLDLIAQLLDF
jgi:hypothetical protein